MNKHLKIYVGCAINGTTPEYKSRIAEFKQRLQDEMPHAVLEFITDPDAPVETVYRNDIKECVADCDAMVADVTYPSLGLGYELATQVEALGKPIILLAEKEAQVSKLIRGIPGVSIDYYGTTSEMLYLAKLRLAKIEPKPKRGKLIVLDGTDGTGKATQANLLVERLRAEGVRCEKFDYPHYQSHFGGLIGEALAGKHGDFVGMSPYIVSCLYAADRFESSGTIKQWLSEGAIVVLDRYVSANQIHQGGKIRGEQERKEFLKWLDHMEHGIYQLPRPDVIFYLSLALELSRKLLKQESGMEKKIYHGGTDQHEDNDQHLLDAKESGIKMVKSQNNWKSISCDGSDGILPKEEIHEKIWKETQSILN